MVTWRLSAQSHFSVRLMRLLDDVLDHPFYSCILFIERAGQGFAVPVYAQGQLGQIIRPDGEAIETLGKFLRQDDIGWKPSFSRRCRIARHSSSNPGR